MAGDSPRSRLIAFAMQMALGMLLPAIAWAQPAAPVRSAGNLLPSDIHDRRQILDSQSRIQAALTANPWDGYLYDQLGYVYLLQKEYHAAEGAFKTSLSIGPPRKETSFRLALAQYRIGHLRQALSTLDPIVNTDKSFGEAHALKGRILRAQGNNQQALESFQAGWSCQYPSAVAGYELARWEAARENYAGAVDYLRLAVLRSPNEPSIRRFYADMLVRNKQYQRAADQWEILLSQGVSTKEANYRLAELYHRLGKPTLAKERLDNLKRIAPGDPGIALLEQVLRQSPGSWNEELDPLSPLWNTSASSTAKDEPSSPPPQN